MEFQIDSSSSTPIYRQLGDQIRTAIARGMLDYGVRMPSVRELSRRLVVNPNTIARVYTELERDGLLVTRQGVGVFVAEVKDELSDAVRRQKLEDEVDRFLTEAVHLRFSLGEVIELLRQRGKEFRWGK
jgi:GntR family transcriptional regulator